MKFRLRSHYFVCVAFLCFHELHPQRQHYSMDILPDHDGNIWQEVEQAKEHIDRFIAKTAQ